MAEKNNDVLVPFTEEQAARLTLLRDTGQFADGYRYIRDVVHDTRVAYTGNVPPTAVYLLGDPHARELVKLETWISDVVGINSGDNSAYSEFVRGSTKIASLLQGRPSPKRPSRLRPMRWRLRLSMTCWPTAACSLPAMW